MSSYDTKESSVLFPNATPFSLDNFDNKHKSVNEGLKVENDDGLNKAMTSLISEYKKDTKDAKEGMLTGTSMNLNLLQGDLVNYSRNDINKNPIQPFTEQLQEMDQKVGVVSYKEGFTSGDASSWSTRPRLSTIPTTYRTTGVTNASKTQKLIDLETRLSALTTEYTTQYRLYTDDLLVRSQFLQTNTQYLNKIVRDISYSGVDASAAYYYVNPFGYTHRYKDLSSVLLYDSNTCPKMTRNEAFLGTDVLNPFKITPESLIDISGGTNGGGFSRFKNLNSYDMAGYTPCITAKNVKLPGATPADDKFAWVDVEGRKRVYSPGIWPDKRHSSCLTAVVGEPITLTANQYNSIPTVENEPMNEKSECFRVSVSPTINTKLAEIKKQIEDTVQEIKKENQNIINNVATTTIIRRDKTNAEKVASLDDSILAKIKSLLGDYYYPITYVFWGFIILIAIMLIFKFTFMFATPDEGSSNGGEGEGNGGSGTYVSLLGICIISLFVIFGVYFYFSYTYNKANSHYTITS